MSECIVDWSRIEWVMLDMDGTVLDLAYDNYFWRELLPQRYAQRHALTLDDANAALAPVFQSERGHLNWYCLDFWSARTGLDVAALKAEVRHRIRPLPGSVAFLEAVRASGRRLWLVTNAHGGSWQLKMACTGLAGHFDAIVCSHDFGVPKERPLFWQRMAQAHAFDPSRTLFVDDSLPVLSAARGHGISQVVAIRHPDSGQSPHAVRDFPSVLRLPELQPVPLLQL